MPDWINTVLLGFFGNALYDLLGATLVGALIGYLKKRKPDLAGAVLYFLAGFAAVMVVAFVLVGRPLLSKEQPQTTPENIEGNVKAWADTFNIGIQKRDAPPGQSFLYVLPSKTAQRYLYQERQINPTIYNYK